jgi:hypothetical protein
MSIGNYNLIRDDLVWICSYSKYIGTEPGAVTKNATIVLLAGIELAAL